MYTSFNLSWISPALTYEKLQSATENDNSLQTVIISYLHEQRLAKEIKM